MTISKIIKMAAHRAELMETIRLFRKLGAGWLDSLVHAVLCVALIA